MELLNPARVNHMSSTGKSALSVLGLGSPEGYFKAPLSWEGTERKEWNYQLHEDGEGTFFLGKIGCPSWE